MLYDVKEKVRSLVADSAFTNFSPQFAAGMRKVVQIAAQDPKGRYLAFLSRRCFAPVEDEVTLDLSFAQGAELPFLVLPLTHGDGSGAVSAFLAPYTACLARHCSGAQCLCLTMVLVAFGPRLQKHQANPFLKEARAPSQMEEPEEEEEDEEEEEPKEEVQDRTWTLKPATHKEVVIDVEHLERRVLPFPVPCGRYGGCAWSAAGDLLYLRSSGKPPNVYEDGFQIWSAVLDGKLMEIVICYYVVIYRMGGHGKGSWRSLEDDSDEEEPHELLSFAFRNGKEAWLLVRGHWTH